MNTFELTKIGKVERSAEKIKVKIFPEYKEAMLALEHFTHIVVFGWVDHEVFPGYREVLTCNPPYAEEHKSGVFATRSPYRPNPILATVCKVEAVDHEKGMIEVNNLDMFDGTPIIDVKAYFPVTDRVKKASIPEWLSDWPEWYPEEGMGLEPHELETA